MANEEQKNVAATLYQAGITIYNQFGKFLVLSEGRELYYGPASEAKMYLETMGFVCPPGANIGDFITSVAVPIERKVRPGYENTVPVTAEDFKDLFHTSSYYQRMLQEKQTRCPEALKPEINALSHARNIEKNRSMRFLSCNTSPYVVSFLRQIRACTIRLDAFLRTLKTLLTNLGKYRLRGGIAGQTLCRLPQLLSWP